MKTIKISQLTETPFITIDTTRGPEQLQLPSSVKTKVMVRVMVTPVIAQWFLDNMIKNRSVKKTMIGKFSTDMEDGNWYPMAGNANICCNTDGKFNDGQHRMRTIIKTGKTVEMYLELGTNHNEATDTGTSRTTKNSLDIVGCDEFFLNNHGGENYHFVARNIMRMLDAKDFYGSAPVVDGLKATANCTNVTFQNFIIENADSIAEAMDSCGAVLYSDENLNDSFKYYARNEEKQIVAYGWFLHNVCGYDYDVINEFFSSIYKNNGNKCRNLILRKLNKMLTANNKASIENPKKQFSVNYVDYLVRMFWNAWVMNDESMVDDLLPSQLFDKDVVKASGVKAQKFVHFLGNPESDSAAC